ncbi:MAG: glucose 1-dehydrogenase [Acidimicrobiia bacterium]|nr:MAG: glucose 1-dehydrogenase [Acidimicrobiia bacterium]
MARTTDLPTISDMIDLTGKVALVTGGGRGFGFACTNRLAEAGASVMVVDFRDSADDDLEPLRAKGYEVGFVQADVANETEVQAAVKETVERFGRLDILVNNAGVFSNFLLEDLDETEFRRLLDINVLGTHFMTRAAAAVMRLNGHGGSIMTITSIDALRPSAPGLLHYDATKHAVFGMIKSAAIELGPEGIRVNGIGPGSSFTEGVEIMLKGSATAGHDIDAQFGAVAARTPMRRACDPDDVARVALFLASDLSSFINGEQIIVDGGFLQT